MRTAHVGLHIFSQGIPSIGVVHLSAFCNRSPLLIYTYVLPAAPVGHASKSSSQKGIDQRTGPSSDRSKQRASSSDRSSTLWQGSTMMRGRPGMAVSLLCLLCLLSPLLVQGAQSRKLLTAVQEKRSHGGFGSQGNGAGTSTATPEPCGGGRGGESESSSASTTGSAEKGEAQCDPAKWAELHTDYIYTQDVKHP